MTKQNWKRYYGDARWYIRLLNEDYQNIDNTEVPDSVTQEVINMVLASRFQKPSHFLAQWKGADSDVPF